MLSRVGCEEVETTVILAEYYMPKSKQKCAIFISNIHNKKDLKHRSSKSESKTIYVHVETIKYEE